MCAPQWSFLQTLRLTTQTTTHIKHTAPHCRGRRTSFDVLRDKLLLGFVIHIKSDNTHQFS